MSPRQEDELRAEMDIIDAWQPPSPDRSTWTVRDFVIEGIKHPIAACICGNKLYRDDRFCENCGLSNPSFDEVQYQSLWGDRLDVSCQSGHKQFIAEIQAGEVQAPKYCTQCGGELFRPRPVK